MKTAVSSATSLPARTVAVVGSVPWTALGLSPGGAARVGVARRAARRTRTGVSPTPDEPALRAYLAAIEAFPVVSREEELGLARRWRRGDVEAGHRLVEANLRYVARIAARYRGYGLPLADLIAEGNLGLLEAVRRFEPRRGLRFITYAAFWIRALILAYVPRHWSVVGLGSGPLDSRMFFRLRSERARLAGQLGEADEAIDGRLAAKFGTTEERVRAKAQRLSERDFSLDTRVFHDGSVTHLDLIPDLNDLEAEVVSREEVGKVRATMSRLWRHLDERERAILRQRLMTEGEEVSLADLGRRLGISRERVRQLETRLKKKLGREMRELA